MIGCLDQHFENASGLYLKPWMLVLVHTVFGVHTYLFYTEEKDCFASIKSLIISN